MGHCEDVPAVRDVLQEDGLLLLQTLLEVRHGAVACFPLRPEVFYFSHTTANYQQLMLCSLLNTRYSYVELYV